MSRGFLVVNRSGLLFGITKTGAVWGGGTRAKSKQLALLINYQSRRPSLVENVLTNIKDRNFVPKSHEKDSFGQALITIAKDEACKFKALGQQAYNTLFPLESQVSTAIQKWQGNMLAVDLGELPTHLDKGIFGLTNKGTRSVNQDALGVYIKGDRVRLMAADGLEEGGEYAAALAITSILDVLEASDQKISQAVIAAADSTIKQFREFHPEMAASLAAVEIEGDQAEIMHAGDCLVFHISQGELRVLNSPHWMVKLNFEKNPEKSEPYFSKKSPFSEKDFEEIMKRKGGFQTPFLTLAYALGHKLPEAPLQASAQPEGAVMAYPLKPGDRLLLATKGIYEKVPAAKIREIVSQGQTVDEITRELMRNANPTKNATLLVYEHPQTKPAKQALPPPPVPAPTIPPTAEEKAMAELNRQLRASQQQKTELANRLAALQEKLDGSQQENITLQQEVQSLQSELNQFLVGGGARPITSEIPGLEKKTLEPVLISPDFFDELSALRTSIRETQAIAQEKEQEIARLTKQLETTQIKLENAKDSISENSEKYSQLVLQEKERIKKMIEENIRAIDAFAREKIEALNSQLIALFTHIEALEDPSEEPKE